MSRQKTGTVEWRGNPARWWARLTVKDEQGASRRVWLDLERSDLRNTIEDKAAAKRVALKRAKQASKKTYVGKERAAAPRVTLADLEDRIHALWEKDPDLKLATVSRYKSSWTGIVATLGKRPIADLTAPMLRQWILDLRESRSVSTVRNDVNALTRALKDAIAQRWVTLTSNPMKDDYVRAAVPPMHAPEAEEIIHWTRAEFEKLLASDLSDLHFGMLLVSVCTGLRGGELHGLRFSDDGEDVKHPGIRRLHVLRQAGLPRDGHPVELGSPKSASSKRKVPLHPYAATWLDWWRATGWEAYVGRAPEETDHVFPSPSAEVWRPRGGDLVRDLLDTAGMAESFALPDGESLAFTWHALRRTFASLLSDAGAIGEMIDYLLGQQPPSTRGRHYQAPPMGELARTVALLEVTLPSRAGVVHSSRESSRANGDGTAKRQKVAEEKGFEPLDSLHRRRFR